MRTLDESGHQEVPAPLRFGIVGCGAVVERFHLPALLRNRDLVVRAVCDRNVDRACQLASRWPDARGFGDHREIVGSVDAVLVAVPNALHASIGADLLRNGIHVLLEKPMATTAEECDLLAQAAAESGATLAIGLVRRFSDSTQLVRELLGSGILGDIKTCEISDGGVFGWPVVSDALFRKDLAGGGVLLDAGVHVLDLLLHWLGPVEEVRYSDDASGGVESDCRVELTMRCGTACVAEFSRIRRMKGTCVFQGSAGTLEIGPGFHPEIRLRLRGGIRTLSGRAVAAGPTSTAELSDAFDAQLRDFVESVRQRRPPFVPAEEGRKAVELIQRCYGSRRKWVAPWMSRLASDSDPVEAAWKELRSKRVLVLGGTGFIGSRLVESLVLDAEAHVRVLVRNFARVPRIARFPIEMVAGDLTDADSVFRAASGCDVIFHSAYGNSGDERDQRRVTVEGTRIALEAARQTAAARVVYLSTLDVYGIPADGVLDERANKKPSGRFYGDTKLEAERLVVEQANKGMPVVILQPTMVYGPFSNTWTIDVLNAIRAGRLALINDGSGFCNPVYVDDTVRAMLLAAVDPRSVGETFLLSGDKPTTWREYFGAYAGMLGRTIPSMTPEESMRRYKLQMSSRHLVPRLKSVFRENAGVREQILSTPEVHSLVTKVKPLLRSKRWESLRGLAYAAAEAPDPLAGVDGMPKLRIRCCQAKMSVSIEKARKLLGYSPMWSFERGMQVTEAWARWANLLT